MAIKDFSELLTAVKGQPEVEAYLQHVLQVLADACAAVQTDRNQYLTERLWEMLCYTRKCGGCGGPVARPLFDGEPDKCPKCMAPWEGEEL